MTTILDILRGNESVVYFAYGQVFFTLGVIIALRSRKHSRLALAHHLKWLAAFGIVHGVYEWGHAFFPIQARYLSADTMAALEAVRIMTLVASLYLLLQFGLLIAFPARRHVWLLHLLPVVVLLAWLGLSIATEAIVVTRSTVGLQFPQSTDLARIMVGFTGAALASFGMVRQARVVANLGPQHIAWYFRWAALCFGFYAIVAGLIASRGEWVAPALLGGVWPLSGLSDLPLFGGIGTIPAPVLRSIAGLGIAFGVVRGLEVFQLETDRYIEERDELERKEGVRAHLFARVVGAQEEERKRVARELHDETGQSLSAVIMGLSAAAEALPRDAAKAGEILTDVREVAVHTLEGVRQIILGLRPALLDDLGLAPALRRVAEDLARHSSVRIEVFANGIDGRLPAEVETVLFRILQEGMSNVVRHSNAKHAALRLVRDESEVRAVLEDDGIGFDLAEATAHLETGRGLGLIGMRERALLLGGAVTIDSGPGRGTTLDVRLPLLERN
ncbi:MAG: sensor histidine kinase [Chloroflexi bacterium]|nr:sensor histidine kinase [Chloroflexota bacterium]